MGIRWLLQCTEDLTMKSYSKSHISDHRMVKGFCVQGFYFLLFLHLLSRISLVSSFTVRITGRCCELLRVLIGDCHHTGRNFPLSLMPLLRKGHWIKLPELRQLHLLWTVVLEVKYPADEDCGNSCIPNGLYTRNEPYRCVQASLLKICPYQHIYRDTIDKSKRKQNGNFFSLLLWHLFFILYLFYFDTLWCRAC